MMREDAIGPDGAGAAPARPPHETAGVWIGVLMLLLAIPVTSWGYLNEPHRLAFWLFVPPLVASLAAIGPVFLVSREANPGWVPGWGLIAYVFTFPVFGVVAYLLYFLPVFGAWMLTGMSLGLELNLLWSYLGVWWVSMTACTLVLLVSRQHALKVVSWVLPGVETGQQEPFVSYLSLVMPWVPLLANLFRSGWWKRRWKQLVLAWTGLFVVTVLPFLLADLFPENPVSALILQWRDEDYGEVLMWILLLPLMFFGMNAPIAYFVLSLSQENGSESRLPRWKPALIGWVVLAVNATVAGTLGGFGLEILAGPAIFAILLITALPLFLAFSRVLRSRPRRLTGWLWLAALLELPIAYYPFYIDAKETSFISSSTHQADELIANQQPEAAARLLAEVFEKAVRRGMPNDAAEAAVRWAPILLDNGEAERAASISEAAVAGLGDVPFGWYSPPCIGDTCSGEDPVPRQRTLVLELTIIRMAALIRVGRTAEAVTAGLQMRSKAAEAGYWHHLASIARLMARVYRGEARILDAYHSLAYARSRVFRASGPAEALQRLDEELAHMRQGVGDEAFWAAATECARQDPESCGGLVR